MDDTENFYKRYENVQKCKVNFSDKINFIERSIMIYIRFAAFIYNLPTMALFSQYLLTGEMKLQTLIYLPYTDPKEVFGFFVNFSMIAVMAMLAFYGFVTHDTTFLLYGFQASVHCDILTWKLSVVEEELMKLSEFKKNRAKILDKLLASKPNNLLYHTTSKVNVSCDSNKLPDFKIIQQDEIEDEIRRKILEFIAVHKDYTQFVKDLHDFNSIPSFATMATNTLSLCLSIFTILQVSMSVGFTAVVIFFFQLAIPCFVGSVVKHQVSNFLKFILIHS